MNAFNKYVRLKACYEYIYKNIYINRALVPIIWSFANSKISGFRWTSSALVFCAVDVDKLKYKAEVHSVFSTLCKGCRRDIEEVYYSVIERLGDVVSPNNLTSIGHKYAFSINSIRNFLRSLKLVYKLNITITQKWKLAVYTTYYCNTVDELEKLNLAPIRYLSMSNTSFFENILTQYFKNKGIKTYSLQEGIYHLYEYDHPIDSIQYENLETDNLLCWGQYSVDEYKRYGIADKRLHAVGYPRNVALERIEIHKPLRRCVVLLARDIYLSTNLKLLDLLSEYTDRFDFYLKLHPAADYDFYSRLAEDKKMFMVTKEKTISECLNNSDYDFCIAVNTTAYYEALLHGLPGFRFFDGSYDLMPGLDDIFSTNEEFQKNMDWLSQIGIDEYEKKIQTMLSYVLGYNIDRYVEVIMK